MAKKDKFEKTNAMRMLDAAGVSYECHVYDGSVALSGVEVARFLGQDPDRVFKTLVSVGRSGEHYVFMIPVASELDLKKAAAQIARADSSYGLHPWRMQPFGHEETFQNIHRRDRPAFRRFDHVLRRPHRVPD